MKRRSLAITVFVVMAILSLGYLALRLWAHSFLNARKQQATQFAKEHGDPVVAAIERYYEQNGKWPAWIHEDLVPQYVDEVHAGWFLWTDPTPHLSTRVFPFDDIFLSWDFEEKCWRLGSEKLEVEP
ncbi:MAG: hypothetical protein ACE5I3_10780 [Phycisphaerae bacterium]